MENFHIKAQRKYVHDSLMWYVQYWWNTDLRTDSMTKEFPISQVLQWCNN